VVVADAGYGASGPFHREREARGLYYVVGVSESMVVFSEEPRWEWPDPAVRDRESRPEAGRGC
jgi:SRSO17 transposase